MTEYVGLLVGDSERWWSGSVEQVGGHEGSTS